MRRRKGKRFNLKQFILREAKNLQRESLSGKLSPVEKVKAVEYEAGEEPDQLEKHIDFIKALKIKESRLNRRHAQLVKEMRKLQRRKLKLRKKVYRNI